MAAPFFPFPNIWIPSSYFKLRHWAAVNSPKLSTSFFHCSFLPKVLEKKPLFSSVPASLFVKGGQGEQLSITSVTDRSFHLNSLRGGGTWGLGDSTMGWVLTVGKALTPPNHSCCGRPEAQPSAPFWLAETSPLKIANESRVEGGRAWAWFPEGYC